MGITQHSKDEQYMRLALIQAQHAQSMGEVPVGAVVVHQNEVIAQAHNQTISLNDPAAHAEILAMRLAGKMLQNYRLVDCDLYVTLEPCSMCAGAMIHARISNLIFAADDFKTGAIKSMDQMLNRPHHNHQVAVRSGILKTECGQILTDFFKMKRNAKKSKRCE